MKPPTADFTDLSAAETVERAVFSAQVASYIKVLFEAGELSQLATDLFLYENIANATQLRRCLAALMPSSDLPLNESLREPAESCRLRLLESGLFPYEIDFSETFGEEE